MSSAHFICPSDPILFKEMKRLLSPYGDSHGGFDPKLAPEPKPLNLESEPMQRLREELHKAGYMFGELMKGVETLGRPANILVTGPSASKKSTIVGIMRFLAESCGFNTEKVKEGRMSTLIEPKGVEDYTAAATGTQIVLFEATKVLPKNIEQMDLYLEITGSVGARLMRLDEKTGSYEFAQQVVGASTKAERKEGRNPDLVINTDPVSIRFEHEGGILSFLREGLVKSLDGSGIKLPEDSENELLKKRLETLKILGLDRHMTAQQVHFLAVRLRQESVKTLEDGRAAVYMPRVTLILGERVTEKIPVEQIEVLGPETRYAISKSDSGVKIESWHCPNTWLTEKRS